MKKVNEIARKDYLTKLYDVLSKHGISSNCAVIVSERWKHDFLKDILSWRESALNSYARKVLIDVLKKSEDKCTHIWDACYCLNEAIEQQIEELKGE